MGATELQILPMAGLLNCCWTADRLARRGLDHPEYCPLCDQDEETVQHLLVACVFSRQVWFSVLSQMDLQPLDPDNNAVVLQDWWREAVLRVPKERRGGFNSLVALVAWWLWKHRNACVFDNVPPSVTKIIEDIKGEARLWCLAGAPGLKVIWP